MSPGSTTVKEAIKGGLKLIALPSKIILISAVALPILLLIVDFSLWYLLLFPAGLLSSILYVGWTTPRWQIQAYENTNDIHQLQRSAELAGLLTRGSHERISWMLSAHQKERLKTLQESFLQDAVFVDDPSVPNRTAIYPPSSDQPVLALNNAGIWTRAEGLFEWDRIANERIVQVTYSRMSPAGTSTSAGANCLFRFDHLNGCFEIPVSSLQIEIWELDLLLYIYRGRFALSQVPTKNITKSTYLPGPEHSDTNN